MIKKNELIEKLLEKRFGEKNPNNISCLLEINTFATDDNEENPVGLGVQLLISDDEQHQIKEEYQINNEGIVFSWGNTPVIDKKVLVRNFEIIY